MTTGRLSAAPRLPALSRGARRTSYGPSGAVPPAFMSPAQLTAPAPAAAVAAKERTSAPPSSRAVTKIEPASFVEYGRLTESAQPSPLGLNVTGTASASGSGPSSGATVSTTREPVRLPWELPQPSVAVTTKPYVPSGTGAPSTMPFQPASKVAP